MVMVYHPGGVKTLAIIFFNLLFITLVRAQFPDCVHVKSFLDGTIGFFDKAKWNISDDPGWCCKAQFGFRCSQDGHVQEINLPSKRISTLMTPGSPLYSLGSLQVLNLSHNDIPGALSPNVNSWPHLEVLALEFNLLHGSIPWYELCQSKPTKLKSLTLRRNNFQGTLLPALSNCTSLVTLDVAFNQLEGAVTTQLETLTNLTDLFLAGNYFGSVLPRLWGLPLRTLDLSGNSFNGTLNPRMITIPSLVTLDLSNNHLDGAIDVFNVKSTTLACLRLSANRFTGTVPYSVKALTNLNELSLYTNRLKMNPFPSLSELKKLTKLYLQNNQFQGGFPDLGTNLLLELDVSNNSFTGTFPNDVLRQSHLERLSIGRNTFSGTIPTSLAKLTNLTLISMYSNMFVGTIPDLSNLTRLDSLSLGWNYLEGSLPESLYNIASLSALELQSCGLQGTISPKIAQLTNLSKLFMFTNNLTGSLPDELWMIPKLGFLRLFDNNLQGTISPNIKNVKDLVELSLHSNNFGGSIPEEFTELNNLRILALQKNRFTGTLPQGLDNSLNIGEIDLSENKFNGTIPPYTKFYSLATLKLGRNQFSGTIPDTLYVWGKWKLFLLNLEANNFRGTIAPDISLLTHLRSCDLSDNYFEGQLPVNITHLQSLTFLDVGNNRFRGSIDFLGALPNLAVVNISYNAHSGVLAPFSFGNNTLVDLRVNNFTCPYPSFPDEQLVLTTHCTAPVGSFPYITGTLLLSVIAFLVGYYWYFRTPKKYAKYAPRSPWTPEVKFVLTAALFCLNLSTLWVDVVFSREILDGLLVIPANCKLVNERRILQEMIPMDGLNCTVFSECISQWIDGSEYSLSEISDNILQFKDVCEQFDLCVYNAAQFECEVGDELNYGIFYYVVWSTIILMTTKDLTKGMCVMVSVVWGVPAGSERMVASSIFYPILFLSRPRLFWKQIIQFHPPIAQHLQEMVADVVMHNGLQLAVALYFYTLITDAELEKSGTASIVLNMMWISIVLVRLGVLFLDQYLFPKVSASAAGSKANTSAAATAAATAPLISSSQAGPSSSSKDTVVKNKEKEKDEEGSAYRALNR